MIRLCMGSRVIVDRDPRPPLAEGGVRAHIWGGGGRVRLTEGGGRSPPGVVGGCVLTGAERSDPDEPVRSLHDAVKPKLHYAYDRYADAYLRAPT
jgi:hypothetical protein